MRQPAKVVDNILAQKKRISRGRIIISQSAILLLQPGKQRKERQLKSSHEYNQIIINS